jgi:hypothetical protein
MFVLVAVYNCKCYRMMVLTGELLHLVEGDVHWYGYEKVEKSLDMRVKPLYRLHS